ncbi:MAG: flavodoxin family protein [Dehalococcoidia bacterium]|nr:flavodoxin family protein [Dehalococcoidia bacterium]
MLRAELDGGARVLLDAVLERRPAMVRSKIREKLFRVLSLLAKEKGVSKVDVALVKEALSLVLPQSLEATYMRLEDPDRYRRVIRDAMVDLDAYYNMPRQVKRWPPVEFKPEKPPSETKVIAFCASPRKNGNTEVMVDEAIAGAASTGALVEKVRLQELRMHFCTGCRRCKDADFAEYCAIKDDMTALYPRIAAADAVIIGFPVYTETHCGQLAAFFDRWDPFLWKKSRPKRAMVIGGWGFPEVTIYDHIIEHVMFILHIHNIETVEAISACGLIGKLRGLDENGKAILSRYPTELAKVREAGYALVVGKQKY